MADGNTLKVMSIFEVCSQLNLGSEISCLAAHLYHRFFKLEQICKNAHLFELYTVGAASIDLAACFYERQYNSRDLCLSMMNLIQGPGSYFEPEMIRKIERSFKTMAKVMTMNLEFQINHKDTRLTTPGLLTQQYRDRNAAEDANRRPIIDISSDDGSSSSLSSDEDDCPLTKADFLLSKNDKHQISSHRYLTHYLKTIKLLIVPDAMKHFIKLANISWTLLSDFYWSSCVTGIYSNHLACASLMMAIEIIRVQFEKSQMQEKVEFWQLVNKKWNLIFCDDFNNDHMQRAIDTIIEQYQEYERVIQHELSTYVIDPLRR